MIIFIDYVSVTVHYNVMFHFFHLTGKSAKKKSNTDRISFSLHQSEYCIWFIFL